MVRAHVRWPALRLGFGGVGWGSVQRSPSASILAPSLRSLHNAGFPGEEFGRTLLSAPAFRPWLRSGTLLHTLGATIKNHLFINFFPFVSWMPVLTVQVTLPPLLLAVVIIDASALMEWEECPWSVCPLSAMMLCRRGRGPAPAVALTLFFKVTSEGGAFGWMCGRLIKCCSLPRLMGQIAHYAGLYIMSNCLLLPLPANEPPSYTWEWSREGKLRFELCLCSRKGWKGAACSGLPLQLHRSSPWYHSIQPPSEANMRF